MLYVLPLCPLPVTLYFIDACLSPSCFYPIQNPRSKIQNQEALCSLPYISTNLLITLMFLKSSFMCLRGVSMIPGRCVSSGWFTIFLKPSNPIYPLPMCQCLSECEAKGTLESLRWSRWRCFNPINRSNSFKVSSNPFFILHTRKYFL